MENQVKKREWVKNAAIIFLSVMLVLTFFSNTFMNYSLPEVSTQYVQSGSINTKIRGSGTVVSNGKYEVILPEKQPGRNVEAIFVRQGQKVAAGDVIMLLESSDNSDDYYAAKDALTEAQIAYEKLLIEQSGDRYESEKAAVERARDALSEANSDNRRAERAEDYISSAEDEYNSAKTAYDEISKHLKAVEKTETLDKAENEKNLMNEAEEKMKLYEKNSELYNSWKVIYDIHKEAYDVLKNNTSIVSEKENLLRVTEINRDDAKKAMDIAEKEIPDEEDPDYQTKRDNYEFAKSVYEGYEAKIKTLETEIKELKTTNSYSKLFEKLADAKNSLDKAEKNLADIKDLYSSDIGAQKDTDSLREAYNDAVDALEKAMQSDKVEDKVDALEREKKAREVEKAKKALEAFGEEGDASNEVVAKNAGTVSEINATVGKPVYGGDTVAVIDIEDAGYSVSFSVTAEQAKKLSIGDTADVENYYWWGSEITAVLDSIKTEQGSGGAKKVLTFNLKGDIEPDVNLNLSIGQKSQNYEAIVPNSAIRNDTNGSFVLVLTTKSSPLNNRYVATRVDVNVFASDDLNSAVSGLGYGDYVITTSSKPIEAGTLVRMAEG